MYPFVKRCIDILGAGLGLIVLSPILMILFIAIGINMGKPIVFKQIRPGLHGKPFKIFKFRTMTNVQDDAGVYCIMK